MVLKARDGDRLKFLRFCGCALQVAVRGVRKVVRYVVAEREPRRGKERYSENSMIIGQRLGALRSAA